MAHEQPVFKIGNLVANADLSAKQFFCVKLANDSGIAEVALCSVAGEKVLGILQNKPNIDQVADVMVSGISKAVAGAAITAAALVMTDAAGKVITAATTGSTIIGWALASAGGANEIIPVAVHPAMGVV